MQPKNNDNGNNSSGSTGAPPSTCGTYAGTWALSGTCAETSCTISQTGCNVSVSCGNGSNLTGTINGNAGTLTGTQGPNSLSCQFTFPASNGFTVTCTPDCTSQGTKS